MKNLEKENHIPELYDLKHVCDNEKHVSYNYEDNILIDSLSKQMFKNNLTRSFLEKLKESMILMVKTNVIIRNWFNYTVDKYYDKHNN